MRDVQRGSRGNPLLGLRCTGMNPREGKAYLAGMLRAGDKEAASRVGATLAKHDLRILVA